MTCHSHRTAAAPAYGAGAGVRRSARARLRARKRRRRRRFFLCAAAVLALGLAATRLAPPLSTGRGSPAGAAALSLSTGAGALSGETRAALEALCEADARAAAILDDPGAYPAELVELLVTAPDALDLVLAWPDIRDTPPADSVGALTAGEVPLLFQWDTRWGLDVYKRQPQSFAHASAMAPFMSTHSLYAASSNATPGCFLYASRMPRLEFTVPPLPFHRYWAMSSALPPCAP